MSGPSASLRQIGLLWALVGLVAIVACRQPSTSTSTSAPTAATMNLVTFTIAGMHCDGCAMAITEALNEAEGVVEAKVTFTDKRAVVRFDPSKTSVKALTLAIERAGYKPSVAAADGAIAPPSQP